MAVEGPAPSPRGQGQRLTGEDRANLVAYLDGELPEAEARAIAARLTQSVTARREIETLERSWQLLDHLPRPEVPEAFLSRTLTEARALDRREDRPYTALAGAGRQAVVVAVWLVGAIAAFAVGALISARLVPDPTARLARDLMLAEHFEDFRAVGSADRLKELSQLADLLEREDARP